MVNSPAFNLEGELQWQVNMVRDLGGSISIVDAGEPETYGWGYCWSPLVDDNKVICVPGGDRGMIAALDRETGEVIWRSEKPNRRRNILLTDQSHL
jgi:outer membrane protein assembly factor BamB